MRKNTRLFRQLPTLLDKVKRLCESGRPRALNLEIDGVRYCGKDMSYLTFSEDGIAFGVEKEEFFVKLEDIKFIKRLRTRKYLFTVEKLAEKSEKKEEELKPKKKATTKKAKKEAEKVEEKIEDSPKGE